MPLPTKDKIVMLRVAAEDLALWQAAAEAEDMKVPDWLRRLAKKAATKKR